MATSKILRITIEYEDRYDSLYDEEAEKFCHEIETLVQDRTWNWSTYEKHIKHCLHAHRTVSGRDCFICCKCRHLSNTGPEEESEHKEEEST